MREVRELRLHLAVADLLRDHAEKGVVWWHTANGNVGPKYGAKLKRLGVRAGVPDFTLIVPEGNDHYVAFIELKSDKGRLSEPQKQFRDAVVEMNCTYRTIHDLDEAVQFLTAIAAIKPMRVAA